MLIYHKYFLTNIRDMVVWSTLRAFSTSWTLFCLPATYTVLLPPHFPPSFLAGNYFRPSVKKTEKEKSNKLFLKKK